MTRHWRAMMMTKSSYSRTRKKLCSTQTESQALILTKSHPMFLTTKLKVYVKKCIESLHKCSFVYEYLFRNIDHQNNVITSVTYEEELSSLGSPRQSVINTEDKSSMQTQSARQSKLDPDDKDKNSLPIARNSANTCSESNNENDEMEDKDTNGSRLKKRLKKKTDKAKQ